MMRPFILPLLALLAGAAPAAAQTVPSFASSGPLGHIDAAAAQRGFAVYEASCAACHSLSALHYRDLEGLGLTSAQVAGIASGIKLADGTAATPDSPFKPATLPASAFGGALPPDLSSIAAQRPGGAAYIYAVLTGYTPAPAGITLMPSHYYNSAYPGGQIAMPPPLHDGAVTYADGTPSTTAQEAADVAEFLTWASDPTLTARHEIGLRALIFFGFLFVLALVLKRQAWSNQS
ncbi:cytochrome c1 [Acidocella sp.]|uniref:cytochrome c1 n=1 Tax=Acidocella sp. TaxID=50710 RepID=UPI00263A161C|nr:cytochrome c1 [Acidocella sp.]